MQGLLKVQNPALSSDLFAGIVEGLGKSSRGTGSWSNRVSTAQSKHAQRSTFIRSMAALVHPAKIRRGSVWINSGSSLALHKNPLRQKHWHEQKMAAFQQKRHHHQLPVVDFCTPGWLSFPSMSIQALMCGVWWSHGAMTTICSSISQSQWACGELQCIKYGRCWKEATISKVWMFHTVILPNSTEDQNSRGTVSPIHLTTCEIWSQ